MEEHTIKSADVKINIISVGEEGRGRKFSYIPVSGAEVGDVITNVKLAQTRTGNHKFIVLKPESDQDEDKCICVFRYTAGYRGGAVLTGDRVTYDNPSDGFKSFPGEIIVSGEIAQGTAGRMGGNEQHIAILPKDEVFRIGRSGRLYGAPSAHYGIFDGDMIKMLCWGDRVATDLF